MIDVVIRNGLVAEALAVVVHLQEWLAADVRHHAGVGIQTAPADAGGHAAAVKDHDRGHVVLVRADPRRSLDAVAVVARISLHGGAVRNGLRVHVAHHVLVVGVAAGADHDALPRINADIIAVGILADHANHAACLVADELLHRRVEKNPPARRRKRLNQMHRNLRMDGGIGHVGHRLVPFVHGLQVVADGEGLVEAVILVAAVGFHNHFIALLRHQVSQPVHSRATLIGPEADELLIHAVRRILAQLLDDLVLVEADARRLLHAAVNGCKAGAGGADGGELFHNRDGRAALDSTHAGRHAGVARADDNNIADIDLGKLILRDGCRCVAPGLRAFPGGGGIRRGGGLILGKDAQRSHQTRSGDAYAAGEGSLEKASSGNRHGRILL